MRVRASSLNYRDLMVRKGGGRRPTKLDVIPLSYGAGEVAAIGAGVTRVKVRDRIAGCFHPRWFGGPISPDLGARAIATTSTVEKTERLKALGASEVIDYVQTPNWDEKPLELTDGRGVDCVVQIGGPGTIAMSLKALAVGGHISLIGASLSRSGTGLDTLLLTGRGITVEAISVGSRPTSRR
jgi:NADPH:quinone reductase-like Zn-dependent oxidoreductase